MMMQLQHDIAWLLSAFCGATGVHARYLSADASTIQSPCSGFCEYLQQNEQAMARCRMFMKLSGQQADRIGEPYIAQCHAGLIEIACPIMQGDQILGTVLCGPLLLWERDELAAQEMLDNLRGLSVDKHALFELFFQIPTMSSDRCNDLAKMLALLADYVSVSDGKHQRERLAMTHQQMKMADEIVSRKKMEEGQRERSARVGVYPMNKERELIGRVRMGDRNGARRILNELLALIFYDTAGNLDITKARVLELVVVISRAAVEGGAQLNQLLGYEYTFLSELDHLKAFEEVCAWVVRTLDAFIDSVYATRNVKSSSYLGKVIEYIQEQYTHNITLEEAASLVPISPYYLSHLFREELGMTFLEYITKVRMEEAKSLLTLSTLQIRDIASRVGYDDAGYFAKVFRKSVGLSPKQYRKQ